jgi:hypothetical protein
MTINRIGWIAILLVALTIGCSGKSGKIITQSKNDSKVTIQELIDNWSDYTIWLKSTAVVFDPKNDDRSILVGNHWGYGQRSGGVDGDCGSQYNQ